MNFLFNDRPSIMGILNVTPDSFSDGGLFLNRDSALKQAEAMVAQGADIIDVGGESTRPGAEVVSQAEEMDRVLPVIERIRAVLDVPVSVDTSSPAVMREAAALGIDLINDVRALQRQGALEAARDLQLPVCLMHMQGDPDSMQDRPHYESVIDEVRDFLAKRIAVCVDAGISIDKLLLDPGFGFGKTPEHNLQLINGLELFTTMGCPLLVGLSRKSTIAKILDDTEQSLLIGSLVGAVWAYHRGARVLRVHDVFETKQALTIAARLNVAGS